MKYISPRLRRFSLFATIFLIPVYFVYFAYSRVDVETKNFKTEELNTVVKQQQDACDCSCKCGLPDFAKLAEEVSPSVVNVSTLVRPKQSNNPLLQFYGGSQIPLPEIFRHFFEQQEPPAGSSGKNTKPIPRSLGSGFVLSSDGYVLTNFHVVKDADEIIVRLKNRSEYKAKLIGSDVKTDLALLKIEATGLPAAKLGDSRGLVPGKWVFAIGSPFGFNYSVTKGIISALNRSLPNESYVPFIQTDVPINPGNSGGPLVGMDGRVVGINAQILTKTGGFMGVSFAIPIDEAAYVAKQLREHGKVTRGFLGVSFQNVDQDLARSFGLENPKGALVAQVVPNSPAAKAGLKSGDIVLKFDNQTIEFYNDLPVVVARTPVGTKVPIVVWRQKKAVKLEVTIEKKADDDNHADLDSGATNSNDLGITVETLDDRWRNNMNLKKDIVGVVVTQVLPSGLGTDLGIQRGDVITEFDGTEISGAMDSIKQ